MTNQTLSDAAQVAFCDPAEVDFVRWEYRPRTSEPRKFSIIMVFAGLAFLGGLLLFKSVLIGALGSVMLLGGTAEFWQKQTFEISKKGVKSSSGLSAYEMEWKNVRQIITKSNGYRFSPILGNSRLVEFRGVFLKWEAGGEAELIKLIKTYGGDDVRAMVQTTE